MILQHHSKMEQKDLIGAALVVAMAQGIMQVLGGSDPTTPTVINTIMYNISNALSGVSGAVAAVLMYLFQSVFNFFVVSGTGQAAITMPIMAPLSDLLGVSRQTAVVAFQLGDAFTNLIVPTSGCLIGSLAIAKIEWSNWIKFMWKFPWCLNDWCNHYSSCCSWNWILKHVRLEN